MATVLNRQFKGCTSFPSASCFSSFKSDCFTKILFYGFLLLKKITSYGISGLSFPHGDSGLGLSSSCPGRHGTSWQWPHFSPLLAALHTRACLLHTSHSSHPELIWACSPLPRQVPPTHQLCLAMKSQVSSFCGPYIYYPQIKTLLKKRNKSHLKARYKAYRHYLLRISILDLKVDSTTTAQGLFSSLTIQSLTELTNSLGYQTCWSHLYWLPHINFLLFSYRVKKDGFFLKITLFYILPHVLVACQNHQKENKNMPIFSGLCALVTLLLLWSKEDMKSNSCKMTEPEVGLSSVFHSASFYILSLPKPCWGMMKVCMTIWWKFEPKELTLSHIAQDL